MRFQVSFERDKAVRALLSDTLAYRDLAFSIAKDGHLEMAQPLDDQTFSELKLFLNKYSIQVIENKGEELAVQIKDIIHKNTTQQSSVQKLSVRLTEELGRKYDYLAKVFVAATGFTIEKYAVAYKIESAKQFISEGELCFKEIAFRLNYHSLGHFSKQFKKHTGLTLSLFKKVIEYRLKHQ